ncbi:MAG TPA: MotA/TolQ/ExbB proton channel family protein [Kofleriaceae bacterium]|jgi:biopolymer transport protein ExbB
MDLSRAFVEFAQLGANWVLWLLVVLSILSIGVMIDRALWFRQRDVADTDEFARELRGAMQRGELDRFTKKYEASTAIPVRVALAGLAEKAGGADSVAEAMHGERARWRRAADRHLIILGTLGNNVPFLGLFGTVLGVMNAFVTLKLNTPEAQQKTLDLIAEALSATAIGLLVAIPAVIAFNLFTRKLKVIMGGADQVAHVILSQLYGDKKES